MVYLERQDVFAPVRGSSASMEADLALISAAAREGGAIGLRYFRHSPKKWLKAGNSPVTEADMAIDRYLKEKLLAARPDYGWISEETFDERPEASYQRYFVVDPIDGTRGFIGGDKRWCVSIAVAEAGRPLAGVLDCPALAEHWTGARGSAALLNGAPLGTLKARRSAAGKPETWHFCGKTSDEEKFPSQFGEKVIWETHIPSLAYRLALLARGHLDAVFVRPACHDWDIAAVDVILQGCGRLLADSDGKSIVYCEKPFKHGFLLAAEQDNIHRLLKIAAPLYGR